MALDVAFTSCLCGPSGTADDRMFENCLSTGLMAVEIWLMILEGEISPSSPSSSSLARFTCIVDWDMARMPVMPSMMSLASFMAMALASGRDGSSADAGAGADDRAFVYGLMATGVANTADTANTTTEIIFANFIVEIKGSQGTSWKKRDLSRRSVAMHPL
ncbi:hypothetical protein DL89DRAFT_15376 [Linderina pennispora]|uniref:Uncharacterized protein n=1 Tax=Linderina pennispora TaxID=61395 RepID=A0A1Y1WMF9_9FUNG|nr:uncharacterized protein DL89DRAFT_15376 [Linderina pennispora]ORX74396.1 hypothetical protein DL89DRAFT_15376 [Linderina pennispora]